jgi:hypothetical protein
MAEENTVMSQTTTTADDSIECEACKNNLTVADMHYLDVRKETKRNESSL